MSFKFNFLPLPYLKIRQLTGIQLCTVILRAPLRALCVALQLRMTVTIILRAFRDWESALRIKVMHCHPPRTTPRASLCSSEWQSLLFSALFEIGRARFEEQWEKGTVILRAPLRALRVALQLRMTVPFILRVFWDWESALRINGIRHCHPPRSTPRFARRFAAPNDRLLFSALFEIGRARFEHQWWKYKNPKVPLEIKKFLAISQA